MVGFSNLYTTTTTKLLTDINTTYRGTNFKLPLALVKVCICVCLSVILSFDFRCIIRMTKWLRVLFIQVKRFTTSWHTNILYVTKPFSLSIVLGRDKLLHALFCWWLVEPSREYITLYHVLKTDLPRISSWSVWAYKVLILWYATSKIMYI